MTIRVDDLYRAYQRRHEASLNDRFLTVEMFTSYNIANLYSLHSRIQADLLSAAVDLGLRAIPEVKFQLSAPIITAASKNRHTLRFDVGYYQHGCLEGVAEVYTLDLLHDHENAQRRLLHFARAFSGILLVIYVLPTSVVDGPGWTPGWSRWGRKPAAERSAYLDDLRSRWRDLGQALFEVVPGRVAAGYITEDGLRDALAIQPGAAPEAEQAS